MFEKAKEFAFPQRIDVKDLNENNLASLSLADCHLKCDIGLDSGFGSLKSISEEEMNLKGRCDPLAKTCPDTALLNFLSISAENDSWKGEEPPLKISRLDDFSDSASQCHSQVSCDNHMLMSFGDGQNPQDEISQGFLWTNDSVTNEKESDQHSRTLTLNPTLVSEEATLGDYPSQEISPNLDHMQSVLRAIIREVGQSPTQEILGKDDHFSSTAVKPRKSNFKSCSSINCTPLSTRRMTVRSLTANNTSRRDTTKRPTLCINFPSRSEDGKRELKILSQPEEQHRARYLTEGSRGAVKDRGGTGFPEVKLFGYNKPAKLQVFIGTDQERVQPHLFYQASKVCGKNSSSCVQRKIDGTVVLDVDILPEKDMTVSCDFVGILKERNVDVEQRLLHFGGTRSKKRSTRCRLVFRVYIPLHDNCVEILQVASLPVLCTQTPGVPEISKKSLSSCSAQGGIELFIIGKNFLKDTKVIFKEIDSGFSGDKVPATWEAAVQPDKEYLQPTHLVCSVPPYCDLKITTATVVQLLVKSGGKTSEPQPFTYTPILPVVNKEWIKSVVQEKSQGSLKSAVISQNLPQEGFAPVIQVPVFPPALNSATNSHQPVSPCIVIIPSNNSAFLTSSSLSPETRQLSTTERCSTVEQISGSNHVQLVMMPSSDNTISNLIQSNHSGINENSDSVTLTTAVDCNWPSQDKEINSGNYFQSVVTQHCQKGEVNCKSASTNFIPESVWESSGKTGNLHQYLKTVPVENSGNKSHDLHSHLPSDPDSPLKASQEAETVKSTVDDAVQSHSPSTVQKGIFMNDFNLTVLNAHTTTSPETNLGLKEQSLNINCSTDALTASTSIIPHDEGSSFSANKNLGNEYSSCSQTFTYFCTEHDNSLTSGNIVSIPSSLRSQYNDNSIANDSGALENMAFSSCSASTFINRTDDNATNSAISQSSLCLKESSTALEVEDCSPDIADNKHISTMQTEVSGNGEVSSVSWIPDSELLRMIKYI